MMNADFLFSLCFSKNRLNKLKQKLAKLHPAGEQYEPQSHYEGKLRSRRFITFSYIAYTLFLLL